MAMFVIYGIPFSYDHFTGNSLDWLLKLVVPDIVERYGLEDTWGCFDTDPHVNGLYLLDFNGKLFLSCWYHIHREETAQLMELPSQYTKNNFLGWCANHNIDTSKGGYYTTLVVKRQIPFLTKN